MYIFSIEKDPVNFNKFCLEFIAHWYSSISLFTISPIKLILRLLKNGILPVFIFDGKPPKEKSDVIEERKEKREILEIKKEVIHGIRALTDCVWFCIHATDEKDSSKVDQVLISKE
jgi:hypothetical protein